MVSVNKLGTLSRERYLISPHCGLARSFMRNSFHCDSSPNSIHQVYELVSVSQVPCCGHLWFMWWKHTFTKSFLSIGEVFHRQEKREQFVDSSSTLLFMVHLWSYKATLTASWLCLLSFSGGQWEGEALQAEEDGQWTLLCVEEQNLSYLEAAGGALLQTDGWSVHVSGWAMQEGELNSSDLPTELSNIVSCVSGEWESLSSVAADGGPSDSRLVIQHRRPVGDWPEIHQAAEEAGGWSVRRSVWGSLEWHHASSSEDPETWYARVHFGFTTFGTKQEFSSVTGWKAKCSHDN